MKSRFTKLAVFTVVVSLLGSALMMGCGKSDDGGGPDTNTTAKKKSGGDDTQ